MLGTVIYNFVPIGAGFPLAIHAHPISLEKILSNPLGRHPFIYEACFLEFSAYNVEYK